MCIQLFPRQWPVAAGLFLCVSGSLCAQELVRPQFETAQQTTNLAPVQVSKKQETVSAMDQAVLSNNTGDLGEQWIYQSKETPKSFTAVAEVSAWHTSNVALTSRNALDDNYFVGQLAVTWQHPLAKSVVFDISLQQAFFRYNEYSQLNFDSLNAGFGLTGQTTFLGGTSWYARYNFNRLTAENYGSELYTSHSLLVGGQKVFQLSRADSLFLGGSAQVNFADPAELERREYALYGGYALAVTRSISCDAIYRAAIYDYNQTDRTDLNQTLSIGVHWHPLEVLTISGSVSGALNRSDKAVFDYDLLTAGATLSVNYQF
ncbi:MAG: hypothetical protein ABIT76_06730 [Chthoniobacterales bacterium]